MESTSLGARSVLLAGINLRKEHHTAFRALVENTRRTATKQSALLALPASFNLRRQAHRASSARLEPTNLSAVLHRVHHAEEASTNLLEVQSLANVALATHTSTMKGTVNRRARCARLVKQAKEGAANVQLVWQGRLVLAV